ncbi:MAG: hypothetical protein ACTSU4_11785 [Promethearchaeota archaeon]
MDGLNQIENCFTCFSEEPAVSRELNRYQEKLDRGIIALYTKEGYMYVGWRLLESDPDNIAFNVYRDTFLGNTIKLNSELIKRTTDFIDKIPVDKKDVRYWVCPIINGKEQFPSKKTPILNQKGQDYISNPLKGNYTFQKVGIADLNGVGSYDFVIKQPNTGLEIYYGIEGIVADLSKFQNGICLVNASNGKILRGINGTTFYVHEQGLVSDIDSSHPGMECYSGEKTIRSDGYFPQMES